LEELQEDAVDTDAAHHAKHDGEEGELGIAHPDRSRCTLQDLLEVDAGESGAATTNNNGEETEGEILIFIVGGLVFATTFDLCEDDTDGEEEDGGPLGPAKTAGEDDDGENSGRDHLHLVSDLEGCGLEVGESDVNQVILEGVESSGHSELQGRGRVGEVLAPKEVFELFDTNRQSASITDTFVFLPKIDEEDESEGGDEFCEFSGDDEGGAEVFWHTFGGEEFGVAGENDSTRCLDDEGKEGGVL